jgi:hypothetical protein
MFLARRVGPSGMVIFRLIRGFLLERLRAATKSTWDNPIRFHLFQNVMQWKLGTGVLL